MPKLQSQRRSQASDPTYVSWRGELLAEMALSRLPGLVVYKADDGVHADLAYDFLVVAERGLCFFVEVKAFSSLKRKVKHVERQPSLEWPLEAKVIAQAKESRSPVFLFLFDADTEHGRFLRLDSLPAAKPGCRTVTVDLPLSQTIDEIRLRDLIASLETQFAA